jgi:hypothetical protein
MPIVRRSVYVVCLCIRRIQRERERERSLLDKLKEVPTCQRYRQWPSDVTAALRIHIWVLQAMWQGPSLDLLRQVYEETQHQDRIEACGYRSATWRILRALKSINEAKVMVGESAITQHLSLKLWDGLPILFRDHSKATK